MNFSQFLDGIDPWEELFYDKEKNEKYIAIPCIYPFFLYIYLFSEIEFVDVVYICLHVIITTINDVENGTFPKISTFHIYRDLG